MNGKIVNGFVVLLSISLVFPPSSTAVRSSQKHKTQVSSNRNGGSKDYHTSNSSPSPGGSLRFQDSVGKHPHHAPDAEISNPPLIRLKRIKRAVAEIPPKTVQTKNNNPMSGTPYVSKTHSKVSMDTLRQKDTTGWKTPISPEFLQDFGGVRVHTENLRRLEDAKKKIHDREKGRFGNVPLTKTNEISEGHDLRGQHGGRHPTMETGSFLHHKYEQGRLESAAHAAAVLRQRNRKKNKHHRNSTELNFKGTSGNRNYAKVPRPRQFGLTDEVAGDQKVRFHDTSNRGRSRTHAQGRGQTVLESKHRTRRGQRSEMKGTHSGSRTQDVRVELERIRRMQRDLMREITQLEHIKKKKRRRSAADRPNQSLWKAATPKRK